MDKHSNGRSNILVKFSNVYPESDLLTVTLNTNIWDDNAVIFTRNSNFLTHKS